MKTLFKPKNPLPNGNCSILILLFIFSFFGAKAQRINKNTLGALTEISVMNLPLTEEKSLPVNNYGFSLFHQRNFSQNFSLRTSINGSFSNETRIEYTLISATNPTINSATIDTYRYNRLSFALAPMVFHREKNFNFFLGLNIGAAYKIQKWGTIIESRAGIGRPESGEVISSDSQFVNNFGAGFSPTVGFDIGLGENKERGAIEIAFAMNRWYIFGNTLSYNSYGLNMGYIYEFKD